MKSIFTGFLMLKQIWTTYFLSSYLVQSAAMYHSSYYWLSEEEAAPSGNYNQKA